jgi:hypothetical protein
MKTSGQVLLDKLLTVMDTGEVPYQANLKAARAIDLLDKPEKGLKELRLMLAGMKMLGKDLEVLENAAKQVARKVSGAVSQPQDARPDVQPRGQAGDGKEGQ